MKDLVHVWNANHDIQYVLDPYSCVVYICDYLTKNNKGMSKLLEQAAKEAKDGNMDLKTSVRHCYDMDHVRDVEDIVDTPKGHNAIFVRDVEDGHYHHVKMTFTSK